MIRIPPSRIFFIWLFQFFLALLFLDPAQGQHVNPHFNALEGVIIETYYIHNTTECQTDKKTDSISGYATYRVYIDLKPGYRLQAIYGIDNQPLEIVTDGLFYNNVPFGSKAGIDIHVNDLSKCNVAFDTWMTLGFASENHLGVLKSEDTDGSILPYEGLSSSDGLMMADTILKIKYYVKDYTFNNRPGESAYLMKDGIFAVYAGVSGLNLDNKVLIAQITTNGTWSAKFNLQVGTPDKKTIRFVAENPKEGEILFNGLNINQLKLTHYGIKTFTN